MRKASAILLNLGLFIGLAAFAYFCRAPILRGAAILQDRLQPCGRPLAYSIVGFDDRFKVKRADFQAALADADAAWNKAAGRSVLEFRDGGPLKVNLVYDERQAATDKLKSLGVAIKEDEAGYDDLKKRYETESAAYESRRAVFRSDSGAFESRRQAYESKVADWNAKGGAPRQVFNNLNAEKIALDAEAARLNAEAAALNAEAERLNALVTTVNRIAAALNKNADKFNNIAGERGDEFQEGRFVSDATGDHIDIFEFEDRTQLVRLLVHELGHALGLEHSENPQDVMYRLNQGRTEKISSGDAAALQAKCRPFDWSWESLKGLLQPAVTPAN